MLDVFKTMADSLINDLEQLKKHNKQVSKTEIILHMQETIKKARTADTWLKLKQEDGTYAYLCPNCSEKHLKKARYCSNCTKYMGEPKIVEKKRKEFVVEA